MYYVVGGFDCKEDIFLRSTARGGSWVGDLRSNQNYDQAKTTLRLLGDKSLRGTYGSSIPVMHDVTIGCQETNSNLRLPT
jgi:hypothetical protein